MYCIKDKQSGFAEKLPISVWMKFTKVETLSFAPCGAYVKISFKKGNF